MKSKISRVISVLMLATIFFGAASQPGIASASARTATLERVTAQPAVPIDSQELEAYLDGLLAADHLEGLDGIVVPGGFGIRGIEGKIAAARHARENRIPYLGLCLGLQCAVIEFSRSQLGLAGANSAEFDPTTLHPVIDLMESQQDVSDMGGTMRLGIYAAKLKEGTLARRLYGEELIYERHRHRYEVNNRYRKDLEAAGMALSGTSPDDNLVEIVEIPEHPFFIASQFHPEFKSRPDNPHPLFSGFMAAAAARGTRQPVAEDRAVESAAVGDLPDR